MQRQTQRLLATLEVLSDPPLTLRLPYHEDGASWQPWFWDGDVNGAFSPWQLVQQEGWMEITDPEIVLKHWQYSEATSLAAPGMYQIDDDDENICLDDASKSRRTQVYEQLFIWLERNTTDLQAVTLKCNKDYTWAFIVGKLANGEWFAIGPNVPNETSCYVSAIGKPNDQSRYDSANIMVSEFAALDFPAECGDPELKSILDQLESIKIYGWYDGGYNHIHDYFITISQAESKIAAIEKLFLQAGFLEAYNFEEFHMGGEIDRDRNKAIIEHYSIFARLQAVMLPQLQLYCFCFWDYEHVYLIDRSTPDSDDRVGLVLRSQFTYNP